jgi:hypothetical protein
LGVIESNALFKVCSGTRKLSKLTQGQSHSPMCHEEERWIMRSLGEREKLLSQLTRRLEVSLDYIKIE